MLGQLHQKQGQRQRWYISRPIDQLQGRGLRRLSYHRMLQSSNNNRRSRLDRQIGNKPDSQPPKLQLCLATHRPGNRLSPLLVEAQNHHRRQEIGVTTPSLVTLLSFQVGATYDRREELVNPRHQLHLVIGATIPSVETHLARPMGVQSDKLRQRKHFGQHWMIFQPSQRQHLLQALDLKVRGRQGPPSR